MATELDAGELANTSDKENIENNDCDVQHITENGVDENTDQGAAVPDGERNGSRVSSPRRVQDIHLDGTADNIPDIDPYMLDERDLDIQSDAGGQAGSVCSGLSVRSWKSLRTPRMLKTRSADSSAPRSSIAGRARQIKDHEGDAFLSIDLVPDSGSKPASRGPTKSSVRDSQQSLLSACSSGLLSQQSVRVVHSEGRTSTRVTGRRLLSASSYISPAKQPCQPNHSVKMPFKHATNKPVMKAPSVSPGQALTESTALATHMVNKVLRQQKPSKTVYIPGRLLKARLKPLEPVQMSVPTIHQCRGIVAETRTYSACQSRTLQRWKAIMSGAQIQQDSAMSQDLRDRASICESVHRTSEASSPDHTVDLINGLDIDYEEEAYQNGDVAINDGYVPADGTDRPQTTTSEPTAQSGPLHCEEELAGIAGPDFKTPTGDPLPAEQADVGLEDNRAAQSASNESVISESTLFHQSDKGETLEEGETTDSNVAHITNKRPHSATYPQESQWSRPPSSLRPKTAVDSTRKAVRFADEAKLLSIQQDKENRMKSKSRANGSKGKSSCKPGSLDSGYHDKDDDKDDGKGSGLSNTFLTQDALQTPKGTSNTGNSSTQQTNSQSGGEGKKAAIDLDHADESNQRNAREKPQSKVTPCNNSVYSHKKNVNGKKSLPTSQNGAKSKNGKKKAQTDETTIQFLYSSTLANQSDSSSHQQESVTDTTTTNQPISEENGNIQYPRPASVVFEDPQASIKGSQGQKKVLNSGNLKDHLDKRFARYKKNKSVPSKENSVTNVCPEAASTDSQVAQTEKSTKDEEIEDGKARGDSDIQMTEETTNSSQLSKCQQDELSITVGKFFQDTDYSKYSRITGRPPSSNSRKAKAYKILKSKTRAGSGRPFSASTYADREVTDRKSRISAYKKDLRPNSAQMFTEKTDILSKHGLIGSHALKNRPNSASSKTILKSTTHRPSSSSSTKSGDSQKSGISEKQLTAVEAVDAVCRDNDAMENPKPRVKSANRVTFADENEFEGRRIPSSQRPSAERMRQQPAKTSSSSSRETSSSLYGDETFDADQMWEELPSDHSDDECQDEVCGQIDEDPFMSKFDLLESQFEIAKAEIEGEKLKCILDFQSNNCNLLQEIINNENDDTSDEERPPLFLTDKGEGEISDDTVKSKVNISKPSVCLDTDKVKPASSSAVVVANFPTMAKYQRSELSCDTVISSLLYKKTNRYVKVFKRDKQPKSKSMGADTRKHMPGNKKRRNPNRHSDRAIDTSGELKSKEAYLNTKDEVHIGQQDMEEAHQVVIPNSTVALGADNLPDEETVVQSNTEKSPEHNLDGNELPVKEVYSNTEQSELAGSKRKETESESKASRQAEIRRQIEKDYPRLTGVQTQDCSTSHTSENEGIQSQKDVNEPLASVRSEVGDGNFQPGGSYQELLQAYRQHCIQGSDDDDNDNDKQQNTEYSNLQTESSLKCEGRPFTRKMNNQKDAQRGKRNMKPKTEAASKHKMHLYKRRPSSATTTDSGLESDSQSNHGEDSSAVKNNQSDLNSHESSAVTDSSNDQSDSAMQQKRQSIARCDSVLSNASTVISDEEKETKAKESIVINSSKSSQASDPRSSDNSKKLHDGKEMGRGALEVVAHAKKVYKPKVHKDQDEDMSTLCKVPPLCFRLNARPPSGFLYYFAYGPAMNPDRLATYLQCEKSPPRFWALLFGFDLVFNKKASDHADSGGFPNLEYNPCTSVEGCIFQLTPEQLDCLDGFMGYPQHYEHVVLPTWMSNCNAPDELGVAQYCVPAVTYIAHDASTWQDPVRPNEYSVSQCLKAADLVTPAYRQHLASFAPVSRNQPLAITAA